MRVALGIDQLGIDTDLVIRSADAPFEHIAHGKLAADLLCVNRFASIGERGIARDHEHPADPRQIGRHILGDSIREILLVGVITEIGERQHDNRQTRTDEGLRYWRGDSRRRDRRGFRGRPQPPEARGDD